MTSCNTSETTERATDLFDSQELFVPFAIDSVVELTLGTDQLLSDATRLQWNVDEYGWTTKGKSSHVATAAPRILS